MEPGTKLQGAVRLHAIIAEGWVRQAVGSDFWASSRCSARYGRREAVKYHPSLLNGEPVEIDTEIDVDYKIKDQK